MPPDTKLLSSKEQGCFASELIGVSGNRKAGGQAKGGETLETHLQNSDSIIPSLRIMQTYVNPSSQWR